MNSIKEIWQSVIDRFKHPLLHSFGVSWLIVNYKFVVVIFSNGEYVKKLDYIEKTLYPETSSSFCNLLWLPLLGAVFYVFILPLISLVSTWSTNTYERWHNDVKAKALRKSILTKEQREENNRIRSKSDISMSECIKMLFETTQPAIIDQLWEIAEASKPDDDYIKPPPNRTINPTSPKQHEFVTQFGIPKLYGKLIGEIGQGRKINAKEASKRLKISEATALNGLISLSALSMLKPIWENSSLTFELVESSWAALLNNRPA